MLLLYERLSYQVQCCINCTNTYCTVQGRFLYIIYSSIPSITVLCSFLGYATSLDKVGTQIVYKKTLQFQLANLLLSDSPKETFIQPHLAEALCNLVAWSPLKIDGAPPVACLCIPETVGRPRPRTERGTQNRKRKQLPQYSYC